MTSGSTTSKSELRLLDPKTTRLHADRFGRLHLEIGIEERHGPVRAVRCMPLTKPEQFISIQDDEGNEIGIIQDLAKLDAESRKAVQSELDLYYLKAEVQKIRKVESKNGIIAWDVETNLGPRMVYVRDRQHIRPLAGGITILTDIHEAKFVVPPADQLDEESREWLSIEL